MIPCGHCSKPFKKLKPTSKFCSILCLNRSKQLPELERFWSSVDKNGPVHPILLTKCWIWVGVKQRYGIFRIGKKAIRAHRASWNYNCGKIPGDLRVLHRCDNTFCVNPEHLFLGTNSDNMRDAFDKGRKHTRGTHHPQHRLTEEQVKDIRTNYKPYSSKGAKYFSEKYGIEVNYVYQLVHSETRWSDVQV